MNAQNMIKHVLVVIAFASAVLAVRGAAASEVGTFKEGGEIGQRNGRLIAGRLYKKVILQKGCAGLGQFQYALGAVTSNLRAPNGKGSRFTAGFFDGYIKALGQAVKAARAECGLSAYDEGSYPGELFGTVFCQLVDIDVDALADLPFTPIFEGWAQTQSTKESCAQAFNVVATDCASTSIALELLNRAQVTACAD